MQTDRARPDPSREPHRLAGRGVALALAIWLAPLAAGAAQQAASSTDLNPHGKLATPCATCHTADGWKPARIDRRFDHGRFGFQLVAAHAAVPCATCHASLDFSQAPSTCVSCHQDVHRGELGTSCEQCHSVRAFNDRVGMAQTHSLTRFPLDGAHRDVDCRACHSAPGGGILSFKGAPTECMACHQADFARTTAPPHREAGFPTDCTGCHTNLSWRGSRFDHNATRFPLTGAHQAATCQACHQDGVYQGKPTVCVSCHQTDYNGTTDPKHAAAGFPTTCESCHTTSAWDGAHFDHDGTQFPLTGAHQAAPCQACHQDGIYQGKPTACVSCHQTDYDGAADPNHKTAGFPTTCESCHTTVTWDGAQFDHTATQFPLTGAHLATPCQSCHADGVYDGKPTACVSCHQIDYNNTTNPSHQSAGFSTDCATCHTTTTWPGAQFDHNTTQFPLTGAHLAATCQACHADGVYNGKPTACVSCHQTDYNNTTNPAHAAAGFPTNCQSCHTTVTWTGAQFDHSTTQFPLTGAHLSASCQDCHADGVYAGKPTACVSCHQTDYTNTTNPNHTAAGFPTSCQSCHTTITWTGAQFDHDGQYFPIYSGKHLQKWNACTDCHTSPTSYAVFSCLTCHEHNQSDMDNKHQGRTGYQYNSQACYSCHPTGMKN